MTVDTLSLARDLRAAELPQQQAEAIALAISHALDNSATTKTDLTQSESRIEGAIRQFRTEFHVEIEKLRTELHVEVKKLRTELHTEIEKLRSEFHAEIEKLRTEFHAEIEKLRAELHAEIGKLRCEINGKIDQQTAKLLFWFIGTNAALAGLLIAALKL